MLKQQRPPSSRGSQAGNNFQDYNQAYSSETPAAAKLSQSHQVQMKVAQESAAASTSIKKQLLEQSRAINNNSVPLKFNDQKPRSGSTPGIMPLTHFLNPRTNENGSPEPRDQHEHTHGQIGARKTFGNSSANKAAYN